MKSFLLRNVARIALVVIYGGAALFALLGKLIGKRSDGPILLIGTFHNPNWVWAHIEPIARSEVDQVILVADDPIEPIDNVICFCPPGWMQKLLTRAGAKFIWSVYAGFRFSPRISMGYHVFPAGVIALITGTLCRSHTSFQVTAGPLELEGGGWHAENALLVALQRDSRIVERCVMAMCRRFDLLVVRGHKADTFLRSHGCAQTIETITGSVVYPEDDQLKPLAGRDIDVLFVGRLTEYKRPDRLVRVLAECVKTQPTLKAVLVGDGPDRAELETLAAELGCRDNLEFAGQQQDVASYQQRAKLFVLTSRWEGVSIAMLEAMAYGCVPVVSNVGDLEDFVDASTGHIFHEDELASFSEAISTLLDSPERWQILSDNSRQRIAERSSKAAVSTRWRAVLGNLGE